MPVFKSPKGDPANPPIDWVMESQCVTINRASDIVDDAKDWAIETMKIVNGLPALELPEQARG
jgi:predicted helicase